MADLTVRKPHEPATIVGAKQFQCLVVLPRNNAPRAFLLTAEAQPAPPPCHKRAINSGCDVNAAGQELVMSAIAALAVLTFAVLGGPLAGTAAGVSILAVAKAVA